MLVLPGQVFVVNPTETESADAFKAAAMGGAAAVRLRSWESWTILILDAG